MGLLYAEKAPREMQTIARRTPDGNPAGQRAGQNPLYTADIRGDTALTRRITLVLLVAIFASAVAAGQDTALAPNAWVVDMGSTLRLRSGPGTSSDTVAYLAAGTPLHMLGRTSDNEWIQVYAAEYGPGWVALAYLRLGGDVNALPVAEIRAGEGGLRGLVHVPPRIRAIYAQGQSLGRQPGVFAKVGDSLSVSRNSYYPIGYGDYELGDYSALQNVIYRYQRPLESGGNAFTRASLAAAVGWTAPAIMDPSFADPYLCATWETPLLCEYRILNPSVALIMVGTNDVGYLDAATFRANLERIVNTSIAAGVIPALGTIPDRVGHSERVAEFNAIIRETAAAYEVPLWDYARAMAPLGAAGLTFDGVHPSSPPNGADGAADFRADNLNSGYVLRNLMALLVLDAIDAQLGRP
jgi:uncharacterized protein YraI